LGDWRLQGCYDATQRLLEKLAFDPARDRLWFCGDLVNRGGQSVETLRLVHSLRANSVVVLGNHDLSLLAISERREDEQRKVNADLQGVLFAPDSNELIGWLRTQKLLHVDRSLGWMMVHAGLAPKWTTTMAERHAREVEERLHGDQPRACSRTCTATSRHGTPSSPASIATARSSMSSPVCATARRAAASVSRTRARRVPSSRASIPGTKCRAASSGTSRSCAGTGRRWGCSSAMACMRSIPARCGVAS
jgi:hypothetical protein